MENQRGMGRLRAGAPFSIPFIFLLLAWSEAWAGAPAPAPAVTTPGPHRPEHQIANLGDFRFESPPRIRNTRGTPTHAGSRKRSRGRPAMHRRPASFSAQSSSLLPVTL